MSSLGRINVFIDIIELVIEKDKDGFSRETDKIIAASVRAYEEDRHRSTRWVNMASFSEASTLFRLCEIPGINAGRGMLSLLEHLNCIMCSFVHVSYILTN